MKFKEVNAVDFTENLFELIGKKWMLVTAADGEKVNTMTASWGGAGVMWGKNVVFVVIRPTRYTKEFVDKADTLSLTFFNEEYRKMLSYMGSVSGRDEDKIANQNLTVKFDEETPYFDEAKIVIKAKKLYKQELKPECVIDENIDQRWYPNHDYHTLYICEIEKILVD